VRSEYRIVCSRGCLGHTWPHRNLTEAAKEAKRLNSEGPDQQSYFEAEARGCLPWDVQERTVSDWRTIA